MLKYKIDVIEELKKRGWNTTVIRKTGIIGQKTLYEIKAGKVPGEKVINILSAMLNLQPGSFICYEPDQDTTQIIESAKEKIKK